MQRMKANRSSSAPSMTSEMRPHSGDAYRQPLVPVLSDHLDTCSLQIALSPIGMGKKLLQIVSCEEIEEVQACSVFRHIFFRCQ